jgi:hypothetical protein
MSYARCNIWLRDLNCTPKNVWKVELVVKTCGGDYLVDFNPDILEKLREAYPDYDVEQGNRDDETTIRIIQPKPHHPQVIKHLELPIPPGCYIVRAWVCWGNLWTDRAMVIVGCGQEACVNLIVPQRINCIPNVIFPVGIAAHELGLEPERVRIAMGVLMQTGKIRREALLSEVKSLTRELEDSDAKDASRYREGLESIGEVIKGMRSKED